VMSANSVAPGAQQKRFADLVAWRKPRGTWIVQRR